MSPNLPGGGHDVSSYVLDELSEDERLDFERLLADDPAAAREAEDLRRLVTRMDSVENAAFEPAEPPVLRLDTATHAERLAAPEHAKVRIKRESLLARLFSGAARQPALAATLIALIFAGGVGAGLALSGTSDDDTADGVISASATLKPVGTLAPAASGEAQLKDSGETMAVRVSGLSANAEGDFYEAWLLNADKGLVSLGSFKVGDDGKAEIRVPVPVDPSAFPVVDISLEPADGAPGHSGKSVLRAELS